MTSYATVLQFVFEVWSLGFTFAVVLYYAAKFFFSPMGFFRYWSGPA